VLATSAVGDRLVLTVEDRGEGIPAEALPHIFERFFQARTNGSPRPRGAGLGLSTVKAMVEAHGGEVRVASRLGEGTHVVIEVPGFVPSPQRQARPQWRPQAAGLIRVARG
jgi:signal transduction histidine kinase